MAENWVVKSVAVDNGNITSRRWPETYGPRMTHSWTAGTETHLVSVSPGPSSFSTRQRKHSHTLPTASGVGRTTLLAPSLEDCGEKAKVYTQGTPPVSCGTEGDEGCWTLGIISCKYLEANIGQRLLKDMQKRRRKINHNYASWYFSFECVISGRTSICFIS